MALFNYTPLPDNPAGLQALQTTYTAYLLNPNPTTQAAFAAARRAYRAHNTTSTSTPTYAPSTKTYTKTPEYTTAATAYVLPKTVHTTPAPQFSAPTSTQRKKTGFKNKLVLGAMLLIGLNFSDQLNTAYDKLMGKKPVKTHGVGLATFVPTAQATTTTMHFTNFVAKETAAPAVEKATTIQAKANQSDNNATTALPDNTLVAMVDENVADMAINTPAKSPLTHTHTATQPLKFSKAAFIQELYASELPEGFKERSDFLEHADILAQIAKCESNTQGYAETPWSSSFKSPSMHGAFGWGQFVPSTAIVVGLVNKVKSVVGGKNRAAKAKAISQQLAANPETQDMLALPNVKGKNRIQIVKLSDKAKQLMGDTPENPVKAMDLFTERGKAAQDYYFVSYYNDLLTKVEQDKQLQRQLGKPVKVKKKGSVPLSEPLIVGMYWNKGEGCRKTIIQAVNKKRRLYTAYNLTPATQTMDSFRNNSREFQATDTTAILPSQSDRRLRL